MASFSRDIVSAAVVAVLLGFLIFLDKSERAPRIYGALHAWMRRPYVYVLVNGIVASIAASSRLEKKGRAAEEQLGAGGGGEEEGLVVSRPYEEVVEEVKAGAVPGACGVALPFGEVVDVGSCGEDHKGLRISSPGYKQAKTSDGQLILQTGIPATGINHVRNATVEQSVEGLEGKLEAQQEVMRLGADELNRRVECFIKSIVSTRR